MQIILCTETQLDIISELFNEYRIFYKCPSDLTSVSAFIKDNLVYKRSKIFLLFDDEGIPVGFSQLYPTISSLKMKPYYYLSDLYIAKFAREKGYARYLMNHITEHVKQEGVHQLTLDTATTNTIAQNLYESLGYEREMVYITYHKMLSSLHE